MGPDLNRHPGADALSAFADGEIADPSVREHLRGCAQCRAAIGDQRLLEVLLGRRRTASVGPHPDERELLAWAVDELDETRAAAIAEHIGACDRCLREALAVRRAHRNPTAPAPRVAEAALATFLAPTRQGDAPTQGVVRLVLDLLQALPHLTFEPFPAPTSFAADAQLSLEENLLGQVTEARDVAMHTRLGAAPAERSGKYNPVRFAPRIELPLGGLRLALELRPPRALLADLGRTLKLDGQELASGIAARIYAQPEACSLDLRAIDERTGAPLAGVEVSLVAQATGEHDVQCTDPDGRASLQVPGAVSRLTVAGHGSVEVRLAPT